MAAIAIAGMAVILWLWYQTKVNAAYQQGVAALNAANTINVPGLGSF